MIRTHWTSTSAITHEQPRTAGPVVSAEEVEALYALWRATPDKATFVCGLAVLQAAALCDYVHHREPSVPSQSREEARRDAIALILNTSDEEMISAAYAAIERLTRGKWIAPSQITLAVIRRALDSQ